MTQAAFVPKIWTFRNVPRDDGMNYPPSQGFGPTSGDYVEQLTYLLFLKMADERTKPPYVPASGSPAQNMQAGAHKQPYTVPEDYAWQTLVKRDGDELFDHYRHTLENLGNEKGLLGLIFNKSQNKFQDPANLRSAGRLGQSIFKQAFSGNFNGSTRYAH